MISRERHECPADGCSIMLKFDTLACYNHWKKLPTPLRIRLSRAWASGDEGAYLEVLAEAVEVMNTP